MSTPTYANFDLLIDRGPTGYRARVIRSLAGEASTDFALPFTEEELADFLWRTASGTRHLGVTPDEAGSVLDPRAFGARLYAAAFAGPVGLCLRRSLDEAERRSVGLRLRLRLDAGVLDLAELPWEFLFVPDLDRFLALSDLTPIVRYVELDRPVQPLRARLPLTVLAVVSTPSDVQPLDVEREWQNLQGAIDPLLQRGVIALERLESATLPALQARLRRGPVDLLHFVGHGFFDPKSNTGGLVFENDRGQSEIATAETLGMLLHDHEALRLIFLNACEGAQGGRSDPFAGIAQRLAQQGAPAVLAMQFPVTDAAAIALSQAFYQALADGLPADAALSEARKAIAAQGNSLEWATPVLFSRSEDNRLFDLRDVLPAPDCPYPGMVPFRAEDTRFFYGREDEIRQMLAHLRLQRMLFVIGPSGSGKSSLIAAGLLPRLAQSAYFPPGFWLVRTMRPVDHPLEALARSIEGDARQPDQAVAALLATHTPADRLLLVIDQFEEVFSLAAKAEQQQFIAALQTLRRSEQCALVIALRADFYPDLMNSDLWPVDPGQRLEIAAMRGEALRQAIRQPAADVEVEIEEALIERLLADSAGEPGVLPMLQETMVLLWERMSRRHIALDAYEQLGDAARSGLAVAVARKADAAVSELLPADQTIAQRVFLRLIQFGEGRSDTRRQLPVNELRSAADDLQAFDRTLEHLAHNRLLTLSGGEDDASRRVDISHEALIVGWPRLQLWLRNRKEAEQARRRLEAKTGEWVRLGRGEGGLLDKAELAEADSWLASPAAVELGVSVDLLTLVRTSQQAINPGWHRWGTLATVLGAISLAALAAWIYITVATSGLQGIGRSTTVLFLVSLGILLALAAWQIARSGPYVFQRLSHTVATKRSFQAMIGMFAASAAILWIGSGIRTWQVTAECARLGYDWTSASTGIAVIADGFDAKETEFFGLALQNAVNNPKTVKVAVADGLLANKCRALFQYRVTLSGQGGAEEQEGVYTATIAPSPKGKNPIVRVGTGCGEIYFLAHETAIALGYSTAQTTNCQLAGPTTCESWYQNEEANALYGQKQYKQAEARFKGIVDRYPDFALAHHNLGLAQISSCDNPDQAVSELQTAVNLTKGSCGWFWYDLAVTCRMANNYTCALNAGRQAINMDPGLSDAYIALAVILRELGQFDEAGIMLDTYAERLTTVDQLGYPQQVVLNKNQGILEFERGRFGEALQHLEKAEQILTRINLFRKVADDQELPYEEEIVFYLAQIHEQNGDGAKACDYWRRYNELPQGCAVGESERRVYATKQMSAAICKQ